MQLYLSESFIPSMWVAFDQERALLGSAAIVECDMDNRITDAPWLASVFVLPNYRGQEVGATLVQFVMDEASRGGHSKLYLYTPKQEGFYQQLGWETESYEQYHGERVCIMSATLATK